MALRLSQRRGPSGAGARVALSLVLAALLVCALPAWGHVGNRLRLGYRTSPGLALAARLAEIYLEAVSAWEIDLKEYPDADALLRAVRGAELDVAVEYPHPDWIRAVCLPGGTPVAGEEAGPLLAGHFKERCGAVWVASLPLAPEGASCAAPSYLVTPGIEGDLAYYGLPAYLRKLAGKLTREELEGVLREDPSGKGRAPIERLLARRKMI